MKPLGISVVIPVYGEAPVIGDTLTHLLDRCRPGPSECIVVDGDPDGGTLARIDRPDVRGITAPKGRASQMNAGAAAAGGDAVLFVHADTRLPRRAFDLIRQVMAGRAAAGAFDLGIDSPKGAYRLIEAMVYIRTRLTRIPYGDQAIFVDRRLFHRIGGYPEMPLMEDVALMQRIKRAGASTAIIPHRVFTSPRRWETEGVVRCTLRNWTLILLYLAGVAPERLVRFYP